MAEIRFAAAVFILILVVFAPHTLCAGNVGETSADVLEGVIGRLSQGLPAGIPQQVGARFAADLSPNGFLQNLRDLHPGADRSEPRQQPVSGSTLFEDALKLLEDLGLQIPLDPESINWEEVLSQVVNEAQQYRTTAWRNVSALCMNNTMQYFEDLSAGLPYAGQMWLSNGGTPRLEALFTYDTIDLGIVEQCQAVAQWNPDAPFETTYCNLVYPAGNGAYYPVVGICVPANCSIPDLEELFGVIPGIGPYIDFSCMVDYPWNAGAIVTVCLLCLFLLLVIAGTTYHIIVQERIKYNAKKPTPHMNGSSKPHMNGSSKPHMNGSAKETDTKLYYGSNGTAKVEMKQDPDDTAPVGHDNKGFDGIEEGTKGSQETTTQPAAKKELAKSGKGFLDTIMMGFSSLYNGSKIMNTKPVPGSLEVLNGIRVISMWWIILGHTLYFMLGYFDNGRYMYEELISSFPLTAIVNAGVSVDTFFFLSGLLLTFLTLKHLKKANGKINWGLFYLHRFVRITPAYMMAMAIWASLAIHFGQGPGKIFFFEGVASVCRDTWWAHLLYINNLYPFPGDLNTCIGWAWYLANDMQFFIISPIIIYLLYKYPKWGMGLIGALALSSFGVTAYLSAYYGTPVGLLPAYNNNTVVVYGNGAADVIYGKPYCRIPAYLVGMVTGYIFYKVNGRPFKMSKCVNLTMWFISTAVALAIVYGTYRNQGAGGTMPQYAAVLFTVFHRPAFVMAVAWVAFSCTVGYGGPVNALLSWGFWAPLSRLTFGAYLLHPIIMYTIYTSANTQYHFSYMQWVTMFLANLFFAYGAAFLLAIGVEGPFMGLEKALLGGGARPKK